MKEKLNTAWRKTKLVFAKLRDAVLEWWDSITKLEAVLYFTAAQFCFLKVLGPVSWWWFTGPLIVFVLYALYRATREEYWS